MPNTSLTWIPEHALPEGVALVHLWGNGSIEYGRHIVPVEGHLFFHHYGPLPRIHYRSTNTTAKALLHIVAGL